MWVLLRMSTRIRRGMGGKQERQTDNNKISFSREVRENRKEGKKGSSIYIKEQQRSQL